MNKFENLNSPSATKFLSGSAELNFSGSLNIIGFGPLIKEDVYFDQTS